VLSGRGLSDVGFPLAAAMGCLSSDNQKQISERHNWTTMIPTNTINTPLGKRLQEDSKKKFIFLTDALAMKAMTLQKEYHCIHSNIRCGMLTEKCAEAFKHAISAYLIDLCSRNFQLRHHDNFYRSVELDVFRWFSESYKAFSFKLQQLIRSKIQYYSDQTMLRNFNDLLAVLVEKYGKEVLENLKLFELHEDRIWLSQNLFCDFIEKLTRVAPSTAFLTELFNNEELLINESITSNERGWWLKRRNLCQTKKNVPNPIDVYIH
jgi:hypothetical protein